LPGLAANAPQTNIVQVDVSATGLDAAQWERELKGLGVLVRPWGRQRLRCVTHRHVGKREIDRALAAFASVAAVAANHAQGMQVHARRGGVNFS
jgi:threonine aldolase